MKRASKRPRKVMKRKQSRTAVSRTEAGSVSQQKELEKLVFLARVNMIELEHQNEELRSTEAELEASRNKYVNLFDFSPIPYFALNLSGIIQEANLRAAKMFGLDRNKLIGRELLRFITVEDRNTFHDFIKAMIKSPAKQSCSLSMKAKDKREVNVMLEGLRSDEALESDQRCQIALIDLTENKRLEETCKELAEEIKMLRASRDKSRG